MDNTKLLQTLLSQIEERDKLINTLKSDIKKLNELEIIRDKEMHKRLNKYKNTVKVLLSLLFSSIIANVLLF